MGTHCSSELRRGHTKKIIMKLLLLTALAAVATAEPGYYGYGYYGYPHQLSWPGVRAPGFEATCFGCRGKRSADPEPGYPYFYAPHPNYAYGPGIAAHPGHATSYTYRSPQGIGKRSADEEPKEEAQAYGIHPSGGKSFVGNTVWGFPRSKRSAEPGYYPYHYGPGIAYHGYGGSSYVGRTIWGFGK